MLDGQKRKIEYVRISLTDRCNLRCQYCMPAAGIEKLRHEDILTFDEVVRVSRALASLGVRKIRLTGGEPLVRRGIVELVRELKAIDGIEQVVLTTNGVQLAALARPLKEAGLDGINLSLDTLDPAVFHRLTRIGSLDDALAGLQAAREAGIRRIKINCVPLAGVNEPDICRLADFAQRDPIQVRYIELMPIGCARTAGLRGIPTAKVRQMLALYRAHAHRLCAYGGAQGHPHGKGAADAGGAFSSRPHAPRTGTGGSRERSSGLLSSAGLCRGDRLHRCHGAQILLKLQPRAPHG